MLFNVIVPSSLLPQGVKIDSVLRFSKLGKSSSGIESTLVAKGHTNIMTIEPWFKLHKKFHLKIENESIDCTDLILGFNREKRENELGEVEMSYLVEQINEREYTASKITEKVYD